MNLLHQELTRKIIKAYYAVYNTLGHGFSERVYENSMLIELEEMGLSGIQQKSIKVHYRGRVVGDYFSDIYFNRLRIKLLQGVFCSCTSSPPPLDSYGYQAVGFFVQKQNTLL